MRGVTLESIDAVAAAFEAHLDVSITWHGAALDRLIDEGHAWLVGIVARLMREWGWEVELEVSYSHYGERGSIDLLGWHPKTATLLVEETKTELGGVDGLLRPLDAKVRLAPVIARERFGWRAARVGRLVVFPDDRTVRRQVARRADVFDVALPDRSREVRRWLRRPTRPLRGLWFLTDDREVAFARNPSAVRRVQRRPDAADGRPDAADETSKQGN